MSEETLHRLVYMANQIAVALRSQVADPAAATCDHLRRFWDPRMRARIIAHWQAGGEALNEIATAAVAMLAERDAA
jgi:formate dehydrogenase subunit delta